MASSHKAPAFVKNGQRIAQLLLLPLTATNAAVTNMPRGKDSFGSSNPFWPGMGGMLPYLVPLLGPLLGLLILLSLGPVLFQKLMTFIRQQIEALQAKPIQVHYTRLEMLERGDAYIHLGED